MSLESFEFEIPETVGEHAEISNLLAFVEECIEPVVVGDQSLEVLRRNLVIARYELEGCLGDCLERWKLTQKKTP